MAAGQSRYERDELVYGLTVSQVLPWLLVLPVLLLADGLGGAPRAGARARAHRRAAARATADDLQPVPEPARRPN